MSNLTEIMRARRVSFDDQLVGTLGCVEVAGPEVEIGYAGLQTDGVRTGLWDRLKNGNRLGQATRLFEGADEPFDHIGSGWITLKGRLEMGNGCFAITRLLGELGQNEMRACGAGSEARFVAKCGGGGGSVTEAEVSMPDGGQQVGRAGRAD